MDRIAADDWAELKFLRLGALHESPKAFLGDFLAESALTEEDWRRRCRDEPWFSAELDGTPVGVGMLAVIHEPGECMHVESMWVHPTHRKKGVAQALIRRIEDEAKKLEQQEIGLWVFVGNTAAHDAYLAMGYHGPLRRQKIEVTDGTVTEEEEFRKALR